jgi:tripeptide aminopeptidase
MTTEFASELEERLLRYCRIDTQADASSPTSPSTEKQYDLLRPLAAELQELGAQDVRVTDYGAVLATIPATAAGDAPTVAFLAHVDTAPQFSGTGVKPIVHRNYQGGDIVLPDDPSQILSPERLPYLAQRTGDDIVTASGTTLLGADDKAGVAIVMVLARHLLQHPELPHGPIRICFTPDEEIGRGVHANLPGDLAADFGYTLDGAHRGEIVYETFSADAATVNVKGVSIHPGWAKGKLVNALPLAARIVAALPAATLTPETTEGRGGFIYLVALNGSSDEATIILALRDFELDGLRTQADLIQKICDAVQAAEPRAQISCAITPQYRNMRYWLEADMRPVEIARDACRHVGVEPFSPPVRGGTDGSRLTELGVPTPNLFTGMQEIHGPLEWVSIQDMVYATNMCIELAQRWSGAHREAKPARGDAATERGSIVDLVG